MTGVIINFSKLGLKLIHVSKRGRRALLAVSLMRHAANIWPKMGFPELKKINSLHTWYSTFRVYLLTLFIFVFPPSIAAMWCPISAWNGGVTDIFTPWPSSGEYNPGILLKTKFSRRFPIWSVWSPTVTAKADSDPSGDKLSPFMDTIVLTGTQTIMTR